MHMTDRVFAPVLFNQHKRTRDIEHSEYPLSTARAYRQRSCFVVADYRLASQHRAVDGTQPGAVRFGRVLYWVRQSRDGRPLRAVVKLFNYLQPTDIDEQCSALPNNLGRRVWRPQHMLNVEQYTKISIPIEFVLRGTVIAMHVQRKARELGLAFCLPSLTKEY